MAIIRVVPLSLVVVGLMCLMAQAGGIRTFHSYHGTGRSPCNHVQGPRQVMDRRGPVANEHSLVKDSDPSWWRCPSCGETCPGWRAHTLPDYYICPSCDYHQYVYGQNAEHKDRTHFELYKSVGEYRWRLRADNGQIIAVSGEGYKNQADCLHGIELVRRATDGTPVINKP